jgi:hypothetical protein
VASPPAVVRIFTTQNARMTSGTFAATGAGKTRPISGRWPSPTGPCRPAWATTRDQAELGAPRKRALLGTAEDGRRPCRTAAVTGGWAGASHEARAGDLRNSGPEGLVSERPGIRFRVRRRAGVATPGSGVVPAGGRPLSSGGIRPVQGESRERQRADREYDASDPQSLANTRWPSHAAESRVGASRFRGFRMRVFTRADRALARGSGVSCIRPG